MFKFIGGLVVFGFAVYGFTIWVQRNPSVFKPKVEEE